MKYNRKSIRLKGYDYSQAGLYFVTICCQNREHFFGKIDNDGQLFLNESGKMIEKWYLELENKFPDIECGEYVVMPNHFHCIVINTGISVGTVGTDLRVCPNTNNDVVDAILGEHVLDKILGEHIGSPLHRVVQWFKTMTTNEYIRGVNILGWKRFDGKLWQRNYWEHIIRNEQSYVTISEYIKNNPVNWNADKLK